MTKGTQDGWYLIQPEDRFTQAREKWVWCHERWGLPRGRDKKGVWNFTWQGYSFENQADYVEFMLRWR